LDGICKRGGATSWQATTYLFEAKIPENAFSASKSGAFSGHFDGDGSRKTDTSRTGAAQNDRFF